MTPGSRQLRELVKLLRSEKVPALGGRVYPVVIPHSTDSRRKKPRYPAAVYARQGSLQDASVRGPAYQPVVGIAIVAQSEGDAGRTGYELIEEAMGQVFRALFGERGAALGLYMYPELPRDSYDDDAHLLRQEIQVVLNQ